jgi:hypothetical protein
MKITTKLWIGIGILAVVSPLGIFLPEKLHAGAAWGEWGTEEIHTLVGYIPAGLVKLASLWNPAIPDYAFKGWEEKGLAHAGFAYSVSAVLGIALCIGAALLLGKFLTGKK